MSESTEERRERLIFQLRFEGHPIIADEMEEMLAELRRARESSDEFWDQNSVQCGNCSVMIMSKGGDFKGDKSNNGLSDPGDSEDEGLCGRCAGEQMYIYMEEIEQARERIAELEAKIARKGNG